MGEIYQQIARVFMPYIQHRKVTITVVAGDSFSRLQPRHGREVLVVRDDWYPDNPHIDVDAMRRDQEPNPRQIYFLSNVEELHEARLRSGFNSHYVNCGCFIDELVFRPSAAPVAKEFDAVAYARFTSSTTGAELKRHYLTTQIKNLALLDEVSGQYDDPVCKHKYCSRGNCKFYNTRRLPAHLAVEILRRSHSGVIFSEVEGYSEASCQYLLTGIPVVSTRSRGGRDVWYDSYNASMIEADEKVVAAAVEHFKANPPDPPRIRSDFLARARVFRKRFMECVLAKVFQDFGVDEDPERVMRIHPFPLRFSPGPPLMLGEGT